MEREQVREWGLLEKTAMEGLRKGTAIGKTRVRRILRILILPSFDDVTSYELFKDGRDRAEAKYLLIKRCWKKNEDIRKFAPLERLKHPKELSATIEQVESEVEGSVVESFFDKIRSISVCPIYEDAGFGTDGTTYEVNFDNTFHSSRFVWWEKGPEEWRGLIESVNEFLCELEGR